MISTIAEEQKLKLKHGTVVMQPKYISNYSEWAQPQKNWTLQSIQKNHFGGISKILDLGCRDGFSSLELAKQYPQAQIIGLDNTIPLLEIANENLYKHPVQNLEFSLMDTLSSYPLNSFDGVFSSCYFHLVQDKLQLLKVINHILKPGGKVFFTFFADHQKMRFDQCISKVASSEKWEKYFVNYRSTIKEIKAYQFAGYLYKSGLNLKRMEFIDIHDVFISKLQFMDWLTTWCNHLKYIPEELHYVFLSDVADKHLESYPPDSKGQIHRFDVLLEVDATKELMNG